jgi:hypothetical protein
MREVSASHDRESEKPWSTQHQSTEEDGFFSLGQIFDCWAAQDIYYWAAKAKKKKLLKEV